MLGRVRELVLGAARILATSALQRIQRELAAGVRVSDVRIEIAGPLTSLRLAVSYGLANTGGETRPGSIAIVPSARGPSLQEYEVVDAEGHQLAYGDMPGRLLEVPRANGGWVDKAILVRGQGPTRGGTRLLLVPDEAPAVLTASECVGQWQPTLAWASGPEWGVVGLLRANNRDAIQVALAPTESFLGPITSSGCSVFVDTALGIEEDDQLFSASEAVLEIAAFFGDRIGMPQDLALALVSKSQIDRDLDAPGVAVPVEAVDLLRPRVDERRSTPSVGIRIGRVWWGSLCRLCGRNSREIEFGLATAMALDFVRQVGREAELQQALRTLGHTASRKGDKWYRRAGLLQPALGANLGLAVYGSLQGRSGWEAMEGLSRMCWGQVLTIDEVSDLLAALGIHPTPHLQEK